RSTLSPSTTLFRSGGVPHMPDWVAREAYSREVSSAGFWPGNASFPEAVFYSYAYPEPAGYREVTVPPSRARFDEGLGEFVLPYEVVRSSTSPDETLLAFLQGTYEAAADCAKWDRAALETSVPRVTGFQGTGRALLVARGCGRSA